MADRVGRWTWSGCATRLQWRPPRSSGYACSATPHRNTWGNLGANV